MTYVHWSIKFRAAILCRVQSIQIRTLPKLIKNFLITPSIVDFFLSAKSFNRPLTMFWHILEFLLGIVEEFLIVDSTKCLHLSTCYTCLVRFFTYFNILSLSLGIFVGTLNIIGSIGSLADFQFVFQAPAISSMWKIYMTLLVLPCPLQTWLWAMHFHVHALPLIASTQF